MTNRAGRRRRHKRHKARMLYHPVRKWPAWVLGQEFAQMCKFEASSVPRGCYIDHEGRKTMAESEFLQVATMPAPPVIFDKEFARRRMAAWNKMPTMLAATITTYRLRRRCEGMLFYGGRNRRVRELPATLEEV